MFEKENIDTSKEYNEFLLTTYVALAQEEIENTSQVTRWGYEKRFIKGSPKFGFLLGYEVTENQGVPVVKIKEDEATIIKKIFELFLDGTPLPEIARLLIKEGVKTSAGGELWSATTVKNILKNVTYTGDKLARAKTRDIFTNVVTATVGQRAQYLIENSHPAIVTKETFNKAQLQLNEQSSKKTIERKPATRKPLSGRLICGQCGWKYHSSKSKNIDSWKCRMYNAGKEKCRAKLMGDKELRLMLIKAFKRKYDFTDPDIITTLKKIIIKINQNDHFEFHRLKYFTAIELARHNLTANPDKGQGAIEKLRTEYIQFEEAIRKVEDDREYRNKAIEWIQTLRKAEEFFETITIEYMRAWVMEMTIYTSKDYVVQWIDTTKTEIGDCEKQQTLIKTLKTEKKVFVADKQDILKTNSNSKKEYESETSNKEVDGLTPTAEKVVKVDTGKNSNTIQNIKKNFNGKEITKVYGETPKKLRCVAYCRISTELGKQPLSLKTQVAYYTYLILKNPEWEFVGVYADEGISGSAAKNRTEFMKLMDDCKSGKIDLIITKSISRFSRNTLDCLEYCRMLKSVGTTVYFEKENINTADEKSEILLTVMSSIAQEELATLSTNIMWGKRRMAQRGIVGTGIDFYGYDYDEQRNWVINPEKAEIVNRMYSEFLEGSNINQISLRLKADGILSPKGKNVWTHNTIIAILQNEVYKGDYLYQKTYSNSVLDKRRKTNQGELPQYYIENHHVAIINGDLWEAVQIEIKKRGYGSKPDWKKQQKHEKEIFFKKFFCSDCNGLIGHYSHSYKSKRTHFWRCLHSSQSVSSGKCSEFGLREEYLEHNFMSLLHDIQNNEAFKFKVEKLITEIDINDEEKSWAQKITDEISNLNQELYKLVDEELNKGGQDSRKVDELTEQIVKQRNILKQCTDRKEQAEKYRQELHWLMNELKCIEDFEPTKEIIPFREDIFTRLIESGVIYPNGKIVYQVRLGVEWNTSLEYKDYQDIQDAKEQGELEAKKAEYLEGPEVKGLLKYCEVPRSSLEMEAFMKLNIKTVAFREKIVKPLCKDGRLKRTIPNKPTSSKQKYYFVVQ